MVEMTAETDSTFSVAWRRTSQSHKNLCATSRELYIAQIALQVTLHGL